VDEKMDEDIKEKVDGYLWLLEQIKQKTEEDSAVAIALLSEIRKDQRMEEIKEEREARNNEPATVKQMKFMDDLGIGYPKNVTKKEASALIDEELGKNGQ
jgi:hypothetical protein